MLPPSDSPVDDPDAFAIFLCDRAYEFPPGLIAGLPGEPADSAIPDCVKALGHATYVNAVQEAGPEFLIAEAHRHYRSALQKTNSALASPKTAYWDSTLMAVMMLSNIETMLNPGLDSLNAWTTHVRGCAGLLELRGIDQLQTQAGRLLFTQACVNVLLDSMRVATRVPNHLHILSEAARYYIGRDSIEYTPWLILHHRLKLADIYADFMSGSMSEPEAAVGDIHARDQALIEALQHPGLEIDLSSSQLCDNSKDSASRGAAEVFQAFIASQNTVIVLAMRMISHVLILAILRDQLGHMPSRRADGTSAQVMQSTQIVEELQDEVLAMMPGHISLVQEYNRLSGSDAATSRLLSSQPGVSSVACMWAEQLLIGSLCPASFLDLSQLKNAKCRLSRGYNVIWPLLLVGQIAGSASPQRQGACHQLRSVGKSLDIIQARFIADVLDTGSSWGQ